MRCWRIFERCGCLYSSSCCRVSGPSVVSVGTSWHQACPEAVNLQNHSYTNSAVREWNMGAEECWRTLDWHFWFSSSLSADSYHMAGQVQKWSCSKPNPATTSISTGLVSSVFLVWTYWKGRQIQKRVYQGMPLHRWRSCVHQKLLWHGEIASDGHKLDIQPDYLKDKSIRVALQSGHIPLGFAMMITVMIKIIYIYKIFLICVANMSN